MAFLLTKLGGAMIFLIVLAAMPLCTGPAVAAEYALGAGDRIRLSVSNRPDLSRELIVQADGSIVLERVGHINAAGLSASELEKAIARKLIEASGSLAGDVAIEITAYRPFYVVGNVTSPGAYAFQPDMNLMVAIALAGGIRVPQSNDASVRLEGARIEERIQVLKLQIADTLIRRARVEAELAGSKTVAVPSDALDYAVDDLTAKIVAGENAVMTSRRTAQEVQIRLLSEQLVQIQRELENIDSQNKSALQRQALFQKEYEALKPLIEKGLVTSNRSFDLERSILSTAGELSSLRAASARARRERLDIERQIDAQTFAIQRENEAALRELTTFIASLFAQLDGARAQLFRADQLTAELEARAGERKKRGAYLIMRRESGKVAVFEARLDTPINPGDIVTVPGGVSSDGPTPGTSAEETVPPPP